MKTRGGKTVSGGGNDFLCAFQLNRFVCTNLQNRWFLLALEVELTGTWKCEEAKWRHNENECQNNL